ncbi:MAG: DUF22 domain-containing protein [Archaeoglobaceae archaeon]|nr:DUF22 domain-containing protein [Archaeoglobaceae archaeon]MDW8117606.1 DUF22 domain-containing protein [Archaeoglobaceae archaeon]
MSEVGFQTGRYAYWKILMARRDVEVSKGLITRIPVDPINLPPKTMLSPLSIMRHAVGSVLDVRMDKARKIEEEKRIESAVFMPVRDGVVKRGDVVGILKVYPTTVKEGEPEARVEMKKYDAKIVYQKNSELKRISCEVEDGWYKRWHLARWIPIVADENLEVEKGKVVRIKIRGFEVPDNTIPVPLNITRNPIGGFLDVISPGKPKKVEESRFINEAIFVPVINSSIEKGDIIGVLNIYYISVGNFTPSILRYLLKKEEAKIVYMKNGILKRRKEKLPLLTFKRSEFGFLKPVISAEDKRLEKGEIDVIKIERIDFPSSTIEQPISGVGLKDCCLLNLYSKAPKLIEEDKKIDRAIVCATENITIKRNDIISAIAVYNVAILIEPELFLAKYSVK